MGPSHVYLWVRLNPRVMAMKSCSTLLNAPEVETYHKMQFSVISWSSLFFFSFGEVLPLCRGYSQRILSLVDRDTSRLSTEPIYRCTICVLKNKYSL